MSKIFKNKRNILYLIIALAALALIVYSLRGREAGELDSFASCLDDSGAILQKSRCNSLSYLDI